jgi:rhodanese-related sulfurtransferase
VEYMGKYVAITPNMALKLIEEHPEIKIIDIRPNEDFMVEHLPGAANLDYDGHDFQKKVEQLDKEHKYLIYCKSGVRGGYFMEKMRESGFNEVYNIVGGFVGWKLSKLPLIKE